ncbi:TetR/AcrR family transcriptional regulator [Bifidobacterium sp. ESL0682]|uniref:TetR/AcrR family transcriptional regulator n=1 Tax=Bifidobacterium sp. ESL0682 TaxID=2983212 RepID=UPI0023F7C9F7|nr:TetR/AcrR family transcriptional regulator [Bifidobacterium sp. ESL0682]WEV41339.1 TetR/AcrR family transcriptional regulator [Bifidobacterium sp. ESL0682]
MSDSEQRLLTETVKAIEQHGYQNISLRSIASAAGLTTGSLYRHFSTKEDLLVQAGYVVSDNLAKSILSSDEEHTNAFDMLLHIGAELLSLTQTNPNLIDFFFYGPLYGKAAKAEYNGKPPAFLSKLSTIVAQACQQYPDSEDPNLLLTQVWAFIQGYSSLICHGVVAYDEQLLSVTLKKLLGVPHR